MENENNQRPAPDDPIGDRARAFGLSIGAIRKVAGKPNPDELPYGSPERNAAQEDSLRDVLRAMGEDPDAPFDDDLLHGAGASG